MVFWKGLGSVMSANKRTSGNAAVALWFHVQRLSRAVPECEHSAKVMRIYLVLLCLLVVSSAGCSTQLVPIGRTAILPASKGPELIQAVCYRPPEGVSGYWTPGSEDLRGVEDTLVTYLQSKSVKGKRNWSSFRKQVVGVKRGEDPLLFIYYFHFNPAIEAYAVARRTPGHDPDSWRREPYPVEDGGDWFFRVLYDIKKRRFVWYECNEVA